MTRSQLFSVADVLLWKDKRISAAILVGIGLIWFLFEVSEYSFLTLLCHISISALLVIFVWHKGAETFNGYYLFSALVKYLSIDQRLIFFKNRSFSGLVRGSLVLSRINPRSETSLPSTMQNQTSSCRISFTLHVETISDTSFW